MAMASAKGGINIGQTLKGALGSYLVTAVLHENIWVASGLNSTSVIIKTAPKSRLDNERRILTRFGHCPHLRQLIDEIEEPAALVLKRLDGNVLEASKKRGLQKEEIKFVAKGILKALKTLHEAGLVHTDIKPDNILINYDDDIKKSNIEQVQLGDCGDVFSVDLDADPKSMFQENGHIIGAAVFRSPEAMLSLRWGTATDIWSFGATLICLLVGKGYLIFKPKDVSLDDDTYTTHVLLEQLNIFGPIEESYLETADEERMYMLIDLMNHSVQSKLRKPFRTIPWPGISDDDKQFLLKIMKFDPRLRPTAQELLQDPWLAE